MARDLKLGLNFGYWAGGPPPGAVEGLQEAERLGFDSVWTAEAYGSDCLTPLAWWGGADRADQARHRDRADVRPPARGHRYGGDDDGPPVRRPLRARPRRLRPPGGRGLVRAAGRGALREGGSPPDAGRLRRGGHGPVPRRRRGPAGRRHAAPVLCPVLRRHGGEERELPRQRTDPHGLREGDPRGAGPLPRRQEG